MSAIPSQQKTLFVFVDESGNLDFGPKGTNHFVLSAVLTTDPARSAAVLQKLRYDLLARGSDQLEFHATENSRGTRKRVSDAIQSIDCIHVHSIYGNKRSQHFSQAMAADFFGRCAEALSEWISNSIDTTIDLILINFDSILTSTQRGALMQRLKSTLKQSQRRFRISFMPVKSDFNGQIADYFAWSLFRRIERNDEAPLQALASIKQIERELVR